MEGDNSHVEMKLSSDLDEEVGGNGVGEHLNHNRNNRNEAMKAGRSTRNLVIFGAIITAFFCLGEDAPPGVLLVHGAVTLNNSINSVTRAMLRH